MMVKVKFKRLNEKAEAPSRAHNTDAGYDLVATSKITDTDGNVVYGTGIAVEIPEGWAGFLFPRSSNAKRKLLLTNSVGIIDSGYRGEIMAKFKPAATYNTTYKAHHNPQWEIGDKFCQLLIRPIYEVEWEETDELSDSERGAGGYGSSGK